MRGSDRLLYPGPWLGQVQLVVGVEGWVLLGRELSPGEEGAGAVGMSAELDYWHPLAFEECAADCYCWCVLLGCY